MITPRLVTGSNAAHPALEVEDVHQIRSKTPAAFDVSLAVVRGPIRRLFLRDTLVGRLDLVGRHREIRYVIPERSVESVVNAVLGNNTRKHFCPILAPATELGLGQCR